LTGSGLIINQKQNISVPLFLLLNSTGTFLGISALALWGLSIQNRLWHKHRGPRSVVVVGGWKMMITHLQIAVCSISIFAGWALYRRRWFKTAVFQLDNRRLLFQV
jgi:hypothetical protein